MISWPQALVEDIARRRAVLFLGSGVSKNAVSDHNSNRRPPDWLEFLECVLQRYSGPSRHIQGLLKRQDYLTACEILKEKLQDEWRECIHDEFVEPAYKPADIHRDVFALDARIVLTQNVDKIYDTFALNESNGTVYVKTYSEEDVALVVRGDRRCVLKAHGTVDAPNQMIFSRKEYADARYRHARFYMLLDALVVTHTFLFLGCGLSDPDVRLMLERHAQFFPGSRPHLMVAPRGDIHNDVRESVRRNMNLRIITYRPDENHRELRESVHELVRQVEEQREDLSATRDW